MARYRCRICSFIYNEKTEGIFFDELFPDWVCPVCGAAHPEFEPMEEEPLPPPPAEPVRERKTIEDLRRASDELETHMADIHRMALVGESVIEPMRTRKPVVSWDDILIKGAQLARLPLDRGAAVDTATVIGPKARKPLLIGTPVIVSHMSFGALSPEAQTALALGSGAAATAMSSGEGGILAEAMALAHKFIFEYVPNRYSATEENLRRADAVEIKIGQSAKPGLGGHLPAGKVTAEIAALRGFPEGADIVGPSRFPDISTRRDLRRKVDELRRLSQGRPVGIKFAAGDVEADLEFALSAGPDFITIDGRAGSTGAAAKLIKDATSVPTIYALDRARRWLEGHGVRDVTLIVTGGLRVSSDFAKALALGADAVAIGTAALMAIGCQQYRICDSGRCPVGIATQDPGLRARLDVDESARWLANFLRVSTEELKDFARLTGHDSVHKLSVSDLVTTSSELSAHTSIPHA
ncbi:MAG TPA: glutamate synthase-related protein [Candidatus Aminicenantes bacterium]|nr:glutamate synthase-related protein [Candidatus Aminicenantes bacterium]